jgi:hypothetical protein
MGGTVSGMRRRRSRRRRQRESEKMEVVVKMASRWDFRRRPGLFVGLELEGWAVEGGRRRSSRKEKEAEPVGGLRESVCVSARVWGVCRRAEERVKRERVARDARETEPQHSERRGQECRRESKRRERESTGNERDSLVGFVRVVRSYSLLGKAAASRRQLLPFSRQARVGGGLAPTAPTAPTLTKLTLGSRSPTSTKACLLVRLRMLVRLPFNSLVNILLWVLFSRRLRHPLTTLF